VIFQWIYVCDLEGEMFGNVPQLRVIAMQADDKAKANELCVYDVFG
jgi:hypothetical protein